MSWGSFFFGLIIAVVGTLMVLKSEFLMNNFGRVDWAEKHLGTEGGTRIFYKLLGIIIILLGFGIMFNIWQPLFYKAASPAFKSLN